MKKICKSYILLFLMLVSVSAVYGQSANISGYVRNYTGVLLTGDYNYAIIQNTFNLNFEETKNKVGFKVNPYVYHYQNRETEYGLRQAYLDLYFDTFDLRIGKQQIIWGKADGVFITDVVSPKDLSEFLLRDFDEIRMGITSVKADYYIGNNTFEFVYVPVFTPTRMPDQNSIWYPAPQFSPNAEFDYSQSEVENKLSNSEVFAKFSGLTSAIDFEIMAGYMWDDDPAMHMLRSVDPVTQEAGLTVMPKYHRLGLAGGSFSTTIKGVVLRGESAYYNGKYFSSADPDAAEGVTEKNYVQYLVGLDYTLWGVKVSGQFIQKVILDYDETIVNDQYDNMATILFSKDFLRETLRAELFSYIGLNNSDALIRPKITYDLADGFELLIGANIFTGDNGMFGRFDKNDMAYFKVKYSF
ncbi:hypothetical protein DRQ07_03740 [candidate division KSB1 bacterium]|nr:MAG: hypothetical protein DRQ07_03740 [candidate division KSB1 bacterium]